MSLSIKKNIFIFIHNNMQIIIMIFIWYLQKNLQDEVNKKRMDYCDYVHNCIQNNWLASIKNNFESLKQKKSKLLNYTI
jgi:hypothetical protein